MQTPIEMFIFSNENIDDQASEIIEFMQGHSVDDMLAIVKKYKDRIASLHSSNIPQFSNLEAVDEVVQIVADAADEIDYQYVGYMINKNASAGAQTKYGENHLKLAIQMGLVSEKPYTVTRLGKEYLQMDSRNRQIVRPKLFFRIPIIQLLLIQSKDQMVDGTELLRTVLSEKTAIRRRSNTRLLINKVCEEGSLDLQKQIMNNIKWG